MSDIVSDQSNCLDRFLHTKGSNITFTLLSSNMQVEVNFLKTILTERETPGDAVVPARHWVPKQLLDPAQQCSKW
jgi:hypothetical protein